MLKALFAGVALTPLLCVSAVAQQTSGETARATTGAAGQVSPTKPLGLTQDAWNARLRARGESRINPGYVRYVYNPANVFPVRTREGMITTIKLPEGEVITKAFTGDEQGFQVGLPTDNSIAVKALYPGVDTNLAAFTKDGRVYTFYLRSDGFNSKIISDFLVDVVDGGANAVEGYAMTSDAQLTRDATRPAELAERVRDPYASLTPDRRPGYREYAEWTDFKPGTVVEDMGVYVPQKAAGGTIPYRVFHDDRFTYVDYGPNASQMNEWPSPLIVVQGVEGPVGFHTAGPGGRMIVLEALGDFVLRNGQREIVLKKRAEAAADSTLIEYPVASVGAMRVPSELPPGRPGALVYAPRTVVPTNGPAGRNGESDSRVVPLPQTRKVEAGRGASGGRVAAAPENVVVTQLVPPAPAAPVRTVEVLRGGGVAATGAAIAPGAALVPVPRAMADGGMGALRPITDASALSGYEVVVGHGTPDQIEDRWKSYRVQYYGALNGKRMSVRTMQDGSSTMVITPVGSVSEGVSLCSALGPDAATCAVKAAKNSR